MNALDYMTEKEAAVLAAMLISGGKDMEMFGMFVWHPLESAKASSIASVIESVFSAGETTDVIAVYELAQNDPETKWISIELLNAICQHIQPRNKTMAILGGAA